MSGGSVSAVLFAKSLSRVARFHREVFGATTLSSSEQHESLELRGFRLMIHQIPEQFAQSIEIAIPPQRREQTAIRLDFAINDIEAARLNALRLGGHVDELPPPWDTGRKRFYLGYDPEGNVIGLKLDE